MCVCFEDTSIWGLYSCARCVCVLLFHCVLDHFIYLLGVCCSLQYVESLKGIFKIRKQEYELESRSGSNTAHVLNSKSLVPPLLACGEGYLNP